MEEQLGTQILAIVNGIAGSGKTTLACGLRGADGRLLVPGLVQRAHMMYVDKDLIDDAFTADRRSDVYRSIVMPGQYAALDSLARVNLRLGNSVLIDAPFNRDVRTPRWWSRYDAIATETGARLKVIRCIAPEDEIRRRLAARGLARDAEKLSHWDAHLREQPILDGVRLPPDALVLDTTASRCVERALGYLHE